MSNDIIGIVVTDNSDNVQLNVTPNLVTINVSQTSGNIIGSNYFLANNYAALPATGESTTLYITNDTSLMYRWSVSAYVQVNSVTSWGTIAGTLSSQTDLQNALNLKAPLASPAFTGTITGITKTMVGLSNVDNTSDVNKPISSATQSALDTKAPLASPTFTGTVSGITKTMVGLSNVDNTSDVNKPVSTATQTALDLKSNINNPTFTGTVSGITKAMVGLGNVDNTTDANKPISTATQTALDTKAPLASPTFTGTVSGITKSMIGLGNVDNTTDLLKPISTATQSALNLKYDASNPSGYTTNVGTVTSVGGTGTVSGLSLSGSVTTSGNLTLGGTLSVTSGNVTGALGYTPENVANKGIANGYASLDGGGLVPSTQLPSYVDDVLEFANLAALPATGETGKIYVTLDTNKIYRWSGATYIEVSPTVGTIWGGITGTLANQTDLQNALNAKQASLTGTGFVVSTAGTITYDTSSYYIASNPNSYIALTALSSSATGLTYTNTTGVFSLTAGYAIPTTASSTNWDTAYTNRITSLTVTGSSGAATLVSNVLNIPTYTLSGLGGITATFLSGTSGISYNSTTGVISTSLTQYTDALARASVSLTTTGTSGASTYNSTTGVFNIPQYQAVLTNPVTGTGTTNFIAKFTSSSAIGNSIIYDNGTSVGIGTTTINGTGTILSIYNATDSQIRLQSGVSGQLSTDGGLISLASDSSMYFYNYENAPIYFGTNNSIRVTIASTGAATFSSSVTATQFITGGTPSNTAGFTNSFYAEGSLPSLTLSNTGTNTGKYTLGVTDGSFGLWNNTTSSYRLFITSAGNVGIGTSSPLGKLDVYGGSANTESYIRTNSFDGTYYAALSFSTGGQGANDPQAQIRAVGDNGYSASLRFYTQIPGTVNPLSERMRITSGGNVGIGTSNPDFAGGGDKVLNVTGTSVRGTLLLSNTSTGTSGVAGSIKTYNSTTYLAGFDFNADGAVDKGNIKSYTNNGSGAIAGPYLSNGGTSWTSSSDERLKDIKNVIPNAIESILKLRAVVHTWKYDNENKEHLGLLAQDLQKVYPQVVVEDNDEIKTLGVNYTELIPVLVKAIQELSAEITILKNK